jgi:excisionase family DNA binding protein
MFSRSKSTPSSSSTTVFTLADLSGELRLSRPTVAKLLRDRRIASFRVGRRVLVTRKALERFLASAERSA